MEYMRTWVIAVALASSSGCAYQAKVKAARTRAVAEQQARAEERGRQAELERQWAAARMDCIGDMARTDVSDDRRSECARILAAWEDHQAARRAEAHAQAQRSAEAARARQEQRYQDALLLQAISDGLKPKPTTTTTCHGFGSTVQCTSR
jgi:membrane protein involved in colicin uptake